MVEPFFFNLRPFLSKELLRPSITIGTTVGLCFLIIIAVPNLPLTKGFVVP